MICRSQVKQMTSEKLLLIDDDTELCALLEEYLTDEGFQIDTCHHGIEGADMARSGNYELIVLDVMLPGANGFEVLQSVRKESEVPVLMLTARSDEVDRIVGLEIGADDYLGKPFNPRELVARIRAVLRRIKKDVNTKGQGSENRRLCVGEIEMELLSRRVTRGGVEIELTAAEFALLKALLSSPGEVIGREELNRQVLGRDYSPDDRSIDVHVSKLRRKLGAAAGATNPIKSIRGEGYVYATDDMAPSEH